MMSIAFERRRRVLRLKFAGLFTSEDLDAIDPALLRFLGGGWDDGGLERPAKAPVRLLYDMVEVTALAVPSTRFAERARLPAIGALSRFVIAPPEAGPEFGQSYREEGVRSGTPQPVIVRTRMEAYRLLDLGEPSFDEIE